MSKQPSGSVNPADPPTFASHGDRSLVPFPRLTADIVDSDEHDSETATQSLSDALQRTIYSLMTQISKSAARICSLAETQMEYFESSLAKPNAPPAYSFLGTFAVSKAHPLEPKEWNQDTITLDVKMGTAISRFFQRQIAHGLSREYKRISYHTRPVQRYHCNSLETSRSH